MTSIYLASPYERLAELATYADKLRAAGHTVTSRWLLGNKFGVDEETAHHSIKALICADNLDDIDAADTFLLFTPGTERGGCFVEFGYALAKGKQCVVIGPRTNVFTYHLQVPQCDSFAEWWERCAVGVGV